MDYTLDAKAARQQANEFNFVKLGDITKNIVSKVEGAAKSGEYHLTYKVEGIPFSPGLATYLTELFSQLNFRTLVGDSTITLQW